MKKLFIFILTTLLYCSCSIPKEETNEFGYRRAVQDDGTIFDCKQGPSVASVNPVSWYEVEKDGHRHEFICVGNAGGLSHWPDCKYCKQNVK